MNDDHWYARDPKVWLVDTQWCDHATEVAHGRLTDTYYAVGSPISDNDEEICNIGKIKPADYQRVRGNLKRLGWQFVDGFLRHDRIEEELKRSAELKESRIKQTAAARYARSMAVTDNVTKDVSKNVSNNGTSSVTGVQVQSQVQSQEQLPIQRTDVGANASHPASDSEWMAVLAKNVAYSDLDIQKEYGKLVAWCQVHKKQPTRRRFLNWLNRADKPMTQPPKKYVPNI